jgi:hypothetical protein
MVRSLQKYCNVWILIRVTHNRGGVAKLFTKLFLQSHPLCVNQILVARSLDVLVMSELTGVWGNPVQAPVTVVTAHRVSICIHYLFDVTPICKFCQCSSCVTALQVSAPGVASAYASLHNQICIDLRRCLSLLDCPIWWHGFLTGMQWIFRFRLLHGIHLCSGMTWWIKSATLVYCK